MIDKDTGLPELPEDLFWRVKKSFGQSVIQLRRKVWFFSVKVDEEFLVRVNRSYILEDADTIVRRYNNRSVRESLYGDYPPKKL